MSKETTGSTAVVPLTNGKRLLNELLESASALPARDSDLGDIQLGINEIRNRANKLRKSTKELESDGLTQAHYLLAGRVSIEEIESNIKYLERAKVLETRGKAQTHKGDLDSYLRSKKDENILSAIEQALGTAARDFDTFVNQNITLDWKQRREEVFASVLKRSLSHTDDQTKSKAKKPISWGKSFKLLDDSTSKLNVNENYLIRGKFERYAKIINRLNNHRQSLKLSTTVEDDFDLAKEFVEIFKNGSDNKSRQLFESWQIIGGLRDATSRPSDPQTFRSRIVSKAKTHLQLQFFEFVNNIYNTKVVEKGLPTIVNKIKSFIEYQKLNSNGNLLIVNGIPIWALIFYLLRAGCEKEALDLVLENQNIFKKVEQSFVPYFKAYVNSQDKRLPQDLITKIQNEFNNHIKKSVDGDPYRYAVYKILGRCQLSRRNISNIALTVEDWLWMHFMLVQDGPQSDFDPAHEKYTLVDFQQMILSYGPTKFTNNYLQVLLLSGLYDDASRYSTELNEMDGVHLSIGMAYYQLMQSSANDKAQLKERGDKFSKLLGTYIKSFKFSDPRIAVEYLVLICLFDNEASTCHDALKELILETREFSILLGKVNSAGVRVPGKIEQRKSLINLDKDFLHKVTEQAAITADKEGRVYDGLLLYQLAEEYQIVISIINRLLGEYLSNTELDQPLVEDGNTETNPVLIAQNFLAVYQNVSVEKQVICKKLLKIAEIRQLYLEKDWDETLRRIEELDILPVSANSNLADTRLKAEELSYLDESLLKNIPNLLLIAMSCVSQRKEQINASAFNGLIKEEKTRELKFIAKNCVVFAGMVQYKMPRETFSLLINLEATL
ncbi:linker nucleoporin NIC96 [Cyberlindnera jadinii NRRL Y-1542]|uniref:Nuclear pore protein n=1 Tax=Cyberlindnera jadinii (strain ATCC 18201 / CBS 1600 / BCRC 20928 / JCM 3617 / NBRC 0987 / NRRL Y-1542) TaxID=983966 RepID=A0A1E4S258_CYBJN|nr:NIC-domain-containing protein [Cyberlindnera jadinii NRRL Y-1542]ODV73578.1 NIC-domain-containing protein [Cyberlindnera jadinii NRRL Y-1542]